MSDRKKQATYLPCQHVEGVEYSDNDVSGSRGDRRRGRNPVVEGRHWGAEDQRTPNS